MNAQSSFALETENKIRFLHFLVYAKLGKRLGPDFQYFLKLQVAFGKQLILKFEAVTKV
jgi:hypothetical protein